MTASCWPMRWQRSSAWSWIAGRPLELEEADVRGAGQRDPLRRRRASRRRSAAARRAAGRRRSTPARAATLSSPSRCSASGKRSSTASWTSTWRANTTSASPEARKSWIQVSAAASLPRAASRCRVVSWARRSARSVAAILASSSLRSSGWVLQPLDHVVLGEPVLLLVVERRPARPPGAWPAAAAAPRTSGGARSSGGAGASAAAPR